MLGQTASASVRFEALDALRGVCALLVVLFHIPIYHVLKDVAAFANLQFCVDMFFALSPIGASCGLPSASSRGAWCMTCGCVPATG
jgi:uncharacterized membrane protein